MIEMSNYNLFHYFRHVYQELSKASCRHAKGKRKWKKTLKDVIIRKCCSFKTLMKIIRIDSLIFLLILCQIIARVSIIRHSFAFVLKGPPSFEDIAINNKLIKNNNILQTIKKFQRFR